MIKNNTIAILLLCFGIISCNGKKEAVTETGEDLKGSVEAEQKQLEDSLFTLVMGIHDEVMPKMQDVFNLKSELKSNLENLENRSDVELVIMELEKAEEDMMNWMRAFKPDNNLPHDSVMQFYLAEQIKIAEVKNKIESALKKGRELQ